MTIIAIYNGYAVWANNNEKPHVSKITKSGESEKGEYIVFNGKTCYLKEVKFIGLQ